MRRLLLVMSLGIFLVGCNSKYEESPSFSEGTTSIYGFSNDRVVTYYVDCEFNKIGEYFLDLSAHIPNGDGSYKELIKSSKFEVGADTNLLVDGILVEEIEEKIKSITSVDFRELEYQVDVFESEKGEKGSGIGSTWEMFGE